MSTKDSYLQEGVSSLLIIPRAKYDRGNNIFDSSFSASVQSELEEWTDWMRWDATAIETDSTGPRGTPSFGSTYPDYGATDPFPLLSAYSDNNELSFDDAPFDFDKTIEASQFPSPSKMLLDPRESAQIYSTLTTAEQQSLQAIAMPCWVVSQAKALSEPSYPALFSGQSHSPSPAPKTTIRWKTTKRKSLTDSGMPSTLCRSKKRGHNAIEKRYRTNVNDKIACLRQAVPPSWRRSSTDSKSGDELDGGESDHETGEKKTCAKYGKADILSRAFEYIQYLQISTKRLGDEVAGLKRRVRAFERLGMSGGFSMNALEAPRILKPI